MDEGQFIAALKNRDPEGIAGLVNSMGDRLLRSAFLLCGHEADAQDLVQETFLQALRTGHRFRGQSSVYTWLHGILLNLSRHHHRDRKRTQYCEEPPEPEPAGEDECLFAQDREVASAALQLALGQLSRAHREVLVLRFQESMRIDAMAAQLGISSGTVKSRLHYALREMQRLLPRELNVSAREGTETMKS